VKGIDLNESESSGLLAKQAGVNFQPGKLLGVRRVLEDRE
jgi:hypothetical protein